MSSQSSILGGRRASRSELLSTQPSVLANIGLCRCSKRSGLEKAIYQVEEAIKKRRLDDASSQSTLEHLQKLLAETQGQEGIQQIFICCFCLSALEVFLFFFFLFINNIE